MPVFRDVSKILCSFRGKAGRHYAQLIMWYPSMRRVNTIAGLRHTSGTIESLIASVTPAGVLLVTWEVTQLRALPVTPLRTPS